MTENKRFKLGRIFYTDENPCLRDNGQPLCEIVANKEEKKVLLEVLNDLHEENEQLRKDREDLFYRERDTKNEWRELKQENEQLKQHIDFADKLIDDLGHDEMKRQWGEYDD